MTEAEKAAVVALQEVVKILLDAAPQEVREVVRERANDFLPYHPTTYEPDTFNISVINEIHKLL